MIQNQSAFKEISKRFSSEVVKYVDGEITAFALNWLSDLGFKHDISEKLVARVVDRLDTDEFKVSAIGNAFEEVRDSILDTKIQAQDGRIVFRRSGIDIEYILQAHLMGPAEDSFDEMFPLIELLF